MAKQINTWNRKNISIGRAIDLQVMFWYAVVFFVNLQFTASKCLGIDNIGATMYPQGDISISYGQPLEIFCTAENNYTSDDIVFKLGGNILPSEKVNDTTIRLYYAHPEIQYKKYYCTNTKISKNCISGVLVDRPPSEVTDFKCRSRNLDYLNCTWSMPKTFATMKYNLTFFNNNRPVNDCVPVYSEHTVSCIWSTTTQPQYRQQQPIYIFNLISYNIFGSYEQNITVDHFSVVKPDSPMDLKVIKTETHSVLLKWVIPNNMVDLLDGGLDHKIEYQIAKVDKRKYFREVNATGLPIRNRTYKFELANLPYAYMQYEVRIYIKPKNAKDDEFWSDPSFQFFQTQSEIPSRPPETTAGAFVRAPFSTRRMISVYWKQLEEYEENGANFTYKVLVLQNSHSRIIYPEKNKSLSYIDINSATMNPIYITIWSRNINGSSLNSSHLYIPAESEMLNSVKSFTKLAFENGTYELSWDNANPGNIDNYTLFWCQYNYTKVCVGRMDFTTLEPNKTSHIIHFRDEKKYQFAMAVNKDIYTSGMEWAQCDISRDAVALYAFPVKLEYYGPNKTHVRLYWSMGCTLREGIITGYNITYCPVIRDTITCDVNVQNKSSYVDSSQPMEIVIGGLLASRTYRFDLALDTIYGLKMTNESAYITTHPDAPSKPVNIAINDIQYNSLEISWDPPTILNGNIVKYLIYNYDKVLYKDAIPNITNVTRRSVKLTNLDGFTNYSLSIVACNSDTDMSLCSKRRQSDEILVRTRIGPPSQLSAPSLRHDPDILTWEEPRIPAGTVDLYQINRTIDGTKDSKIYNTTHLAMELRFCEGVSDYETYQIRAVNFDEDQHHGAFAIRPEVVLPKRENISFWPGEWSTPTLYGCRSSNAMGVTFISIFLLAAIIAMGYGVLKLYKKYRKMEDIKPVLPNGLGVIETEKPKFVYGGGWKTTNDIEKRSPSDETLLLSTHNGSETTTIKQDLTGGNDHTDTTTLSHTSLDHPEHESCSSDDGSTSSLHESIKTNDDKTYVKNEEISKKDIENNQNNKPYPEKVSDYIQCIPNNLNNFGPPPMSLSQSPIEKTLPTKLLKEPTTSSYVMAGLSTAPVFTTSVAFPKTSSSGYIVQEDLQPSHKNMKFPTLGNSPTNEIDLESLPTMTNLPSSKCTDSSYIQLQSLDLPPTSLKPVTRNSVPSKPVATGYLSPTDVVMNKHLNILAGTNLNEESPVLVSPAMSPDVYCRFSWSNDPINDNLRAILAESDTLDSTKDY